MTIQELYNFAVEHNLTNAPLYKRSKADWNGFENWNYTDDEIKVDDFNNISI